MGLDKQAIYDRIRDHLLGQNAKARTEFGFAYRSSDGLKCAIGCLIPDELYRPEMEHTCAVDEPIRSCLEGVLGTRLGPGEISFLEEFRAIHDGGCVSSWSRDLRELAARHDLNP